MRRDSFEIALPMIVSTFENNPSKAFTALDIRSIFFEYRDEWNIAAYRTDVHFEAFLQKKGILNVFILNSNNDDSVKKVFLKPSGNNFDIAIAIKKEGFISYYSALSFHGLTLQIPKTIYVSYPKSSPLSLNANGTNLTQENIDNAFSKPQRVSSQVFTSKIDNVKYVFIQKKYTENDIGIIPIESIRISNLERTLIDITVRPVYSGGVFEVLNAYKASIGIIDTDLLYLYLTELDYIYPYFQLVGFYLEKAGFDQKDILKFQKKISEYRFYMTYNIANKSYDEKWKIYFPKGF
ncbi:type IV toxin-antitoxin system AbiEi family antitoxin domain-containing protein [Myroides odoratimimus]|uniref:type IV toxin-antitoxin system AbiEi family antitoxin domain-containing protein n=3 Tax=Myroides odoratimimus TaxID=76832 RepID=UPI002578B22F|nr:hypothetical protein [Myroides odoratimimus]MDM1482003.1 hypothetical protein [Myroides odoratimimus]